MNKQEVIEKIKTLKPYEPDLFEYDSEELKRFEEGFLDAKIYAELAVKELDEPEKSTVPDFVAKYIEESRDFGRKLNDALSYSNTPVAVDDWFEEEDNIERFAKAWLYGYEVEKEKLYTVEIPDPNGLREHSLVKDIKGDIFIGHKCSNDWRKVDRYQLTESEIKKDFDWAFQFAKEV